jgi:TPR repeat protein
MKDKIFICYRREDTAAFAALLHSRLAETFGENRIFIDVDSIGPGTDFVDSIDKAIRSSGVMLILIGRRWSPARLAEPDDFVRIELLSAFEQGTRVIPLLLEGVRMPGPEELPRELAPLTRRQAVEFGTSRIEMDVRMLIDDLRKIFAPPAAPRPFRGTPAASEAPLPKSPRGSGLRGKRTGLLVAGLSLAALVLLGATVGRGLWRVPSAKTFAQILPGNDAAKSPAGVNLKATVAGLTIRSRAFSDKYMRNRELPDLGTGFELINIFPEGPADLAGLKTGDLLRKIDGLLLRSSDDFVSVIRRHKPGDVITLEVWRGPRVMDVAVSLANGFDLYRQACEQERADACNYLGACYLYQADDTARAISLFRQACDQGSADGCSSLGALYGAGQSLPKDPGQALALYEKACKLDNAQGCINQAESLESGRGAEPDAARAATLYERACALRGWNGCVELGRLFENGIGVGKDLQRAAALYEQACGAGDATGCRRLGYLADVGIGIPKDLPRAASLYRAACGGGELNACISLGTFYEFGKGEVAQDFKQAQTLYDRVCKEKNGLGCAYLGDLLGAGKGGEKDPSRAAELYQTGCDLGSLESCNSLAIAYSNGTGVAKDLTRGLSLFRSSCEQGSFSACNNLGVQYVKGEGVEKDLARGVSFYERACGGNIAIGCHNLGGMYENGLGVAKDPQKAAELYQKACNLGDSTACANLNKSG